MAYELKITHFAVGQGLCVVVTLRNDIGELFYLGILDMGSSNGITYAHTTINSLTTLIKENHGKINYVLVSHQDKDHYNLFESLATKYKSFNPENPIIMIEKLLLGFSPVPNGGPAKAIFERLYNIKPEFVYYINKDMLSRINRNPYVFQEWSEVQIDEDIDLNGNFIFQIHCLLAGAFYENDFSTNTGSIIVLITILNNNGGSAAEYSYLFTGDATANTFERLNKIKYVFNKKNSRSILIPHHGSYPSMNSNISALTTFLENYAPNSAFVSAKATNSQFHPRSEIMNLFYSKITRTTTEHNITSVSYFKQNVKVLDNSNRGIRCTFILPIDCNNKKIASCLNSYKRVHILSTFNFG